MSRNYLQLCQDIVSDLGIAGGTLATTTGSLSQEQQRIVNWVARADLYVQQLWSDWKFLWYQDTNVVGAAGNDFIIPNPPANADSVLRYDLTKLFAAFGTSDAQRINWMEWNQFFQTYQSRAKQTQALPASFSIDPSGKIWLSSILAANTTFALPYWVIGKRMVGDAAVSMIPTPVDNIILERAKIIYASRENAPEIMTGASAEYADLLDKMQGMYLPDNMGARTLRNDHTTIPVSYVE